MHLSGVQMKRDLYIEGWNMHIITKTLFFALVELEYDFGKNFSKSALMLTMSLSWI
jgi:hypothetical protein